MDTNLNIAVDMGRVQSSVQAAIRPAVEEALQAYDVKKAILDQLTKKPKKKSSEDGLDYLGFRMMSREYTISDLPTLLDKMVRDGIEQIAKEYVESNLRMHRGEIEEAFRKMMNGSTNRLVKAFAGAVEGALKEDWCFDLDVKVSHRTGAHDD